MAPKGVQSSGFSQEQRLWVILALLCIAVVAFAAGILVNKIQSKPDASASAEKGQVEPLPTGSKESSNTKTVAAPPKRAETKATEGEQVSPAPVKIPDGNSETITTTRPVSRDVTSQSVPAPPPLKESAAAAKPEEKPKPSVEPATPAAPAAEEQKPVQTAMQTTTAPVTGAPKVDDSPLEDIATPAETKPAASAPGAPAAPEPTAAAATGGFTIQVGSFDTLANAEKFKKSVERKSDHEIVLYPAKDGKVVKACVGKYETKEAAAKERAELDRVKDFKGCFVKALNEL